MRILQLAFLLLFNYLDNLPKLYYFCVSFANNHGLVYNEQKTKFMCLKPAVIKNMYVPNVKLNGKALELVIREKIPGFLCH